MRLRRRNFRIEKRTLALSALYFAVAAHRVVDLLTARWHVPIAIAKVPVRDDPVVVEGNPGVVDDGDTDLGPVSRRDDGLVFLPREPTSRIDSLGGSPALLIDVEEALRAALSTIEIERLQVGAVLPRRGDETVGDDRALRGRREETLSIVLARHSLDSTIEESSAGVLYLRPRRIQKPSGVDAAWESGDVLEVCVSFEDRRPAVDDDRVEICPGGVERAREAGRSGTDDADVNIDPSCIGHGGVLDYGCNQRTGTNRVTPERTDRTARTLPHDLESAGADAFLPGASDPARMHCLAVEGLPEVRPGDDLASLIEERCELRDDDVVCVASTVVSKAEDRAFDLSAFPAGDRARSIAERLTEISGEKKDPRFAQAVLEESEELVIEAPFLLAATQFGHVAPNAGIDRSNVPDADLLLLPEDPTVSAERIRSNLESDAAVVVTDTCGRPFRQGQTGIAIGYAGLPATRDWRGETDRDGHELEVTNESIVDELAATANLLTGEGDGGVPAVVVRGFEFGDHDGSDRLFRSRDDDLVRDALDQWTFPDVSGDQTVSEGSR